MQPLAHMTLQVSAGEDEDPEELDRMTRQLLSEIQELDVESADLVKGGDLPEGAKSAELVTLGSLAVVVLPAIAPKLMDLLNSWSMRAENRRVKIKAQVENRSVEVEYSPSTMSVDDLKRLVSTITDAMGPSGAGKPA